MNYDENPPDGFIPVRMAVFSVIHDLGPIHPSMPRSKPAHFLLIMPDQSGIEVDLRRDADSPTIMYFSTLDQWEGLIYRGAHDLEVARAAYRGVPIQKGKKTYAD